MRGKSRVVVLALAVLLVALPALGQASRTRPGGGGSSSGGSRTHATGRATYGHHGGGHGVFIGHGYYPYYPHYFSYWDSPYFYGWPFWGWGFGWGGWYGVPVYRSAPAGDPPGALVTRVRPKKADVRIDGQLVGKARDFNGTWDELWLEPGLYTLEFSREGYQTLRVNVEVRSGLTVELAEQLQEGEGLDPRSHEPVAREAPPAPAPPPREPKLDTRLAPGQSEGTSLPTGLLRLEVLPADAAIYLDGAFLAQAGELRRMHGAIPVATGRHRLEIVRPGYVTVTRSVEVGAESTETVTVELERN